MRPYVSITSFTFSIWFLTAFICGVSCGTYESLHFKKLKIDL